MGLGMVLWPQQPPERGVETSRSLPRRGMLQYLPFLLHDKLPVALESTQLKPLLHQRGWQAMSEPPPSLPGCPTRTHSGERMEGACSCGRAWCTLLRHFILTISLPTGCGPAGRNHHPVTHLRGLLPPSSVGILPAPAAPKTDGKEPSEA